MSYRELRNFCEMMRSLGYPRIISMENFRSPNFKLVAEILFWLIKRFDPKAEIPDEIAEEKDRVEFIKAACQFFFQNLKLKINIKKIYSSDGHCVQELLKIAEILYKAKRSVYSKEDYEYSTELDITSRKNDINQIKTLSTEIVETGLHLLDLLEKEKSLKESREKAIEFLDNISKNFDSKKEQEQIEKKIMNILSNQEKTLEQLDEHLTDLKQKEADFSEDIKMKRIELERAEKRLESLQYAKPAHFSEMRQLETELSQVYRIYVEKIRNHDFLSSQLEQFQKLEEDNNKNRDKELKVIRENNTRIDQKNFHDENDIINAGAYENEEQEKASVPMNRKVNEKNRQFVNHNENEPEDGEQEPEQDGEQEEEEGEESDAGF